MAAVTDPEHQQWLDQVREAPLEPALPICDPHHHLWDRAGSRYLLDELLADLDCGHNIVSTVFVECGSMYRASGPEHLRPVGETEFVNGIAAMSASGGYGPARICAGIVGFADLLLGDAVDEVLEAHLAASPRFRGIRHAGGWDASPEVRNSHSNPPEGMYLRDDFRKGFARLATHGLSFEAWQYHHQLPQVIDLAQAFPDVTIILNHFSGPLGIGPWKGRREEVFRAWKADMAALARCGNVVAKLGGLVMPVNGFGFHKADTPPDSAVLAEATRDWYLYTIDCFGPDRCMFESNFPVDRASVSYGVLFNSFKRLTQDFSTAERQALFRGTAERTYRIEQLDASSLDRKD
ncbi:MAG: amidohydrolase family protein [Ectothiorhodospiraceae bacterium]|nr:amidohydrolase family protein [Ectothiorhodospiraceae bacterium]